jgi:hypothetical protein
MFWHTRIPVKAIRASPRGHSTWPQCNLAAAEQRSSAAPGGHVLRAHLPDDFENLHPVFGLPAKSESYWTRTDEEDEEQRGPVARRGGHAVGHALLRGF